MKKENLKWIEANEIKSKKVRLKVNSNCNFSCSYCHKEGGKSSVVKPNKEFINFSRQLSNLGFFEVHLTGGEPTLNPYLIDICKILHNTGQRVSLTTNGSFKSKLLGNLQDNGVADIHFSFNSRNNRYLQEHSKSKLKIYENIIGIQETNIIESVRINLNTFVNLLVHGYYSKQDLQSVYEFCKINNVNLRILTSLVNREVSLLTINEFIQENGFTELSKAEKLSSTRITLIDRNDYKIVIKDVSPETRLNGYCNDCTINCREGFYGIRAEHDGEKFVFRLCLDRKDGKEIILPQKLYNLINN